MCCFISENRNINLHFIPFEHIEMGLEFQTVLKKHNDPVTCVLNIIAGELIPRRRKEPDHQPWTWHWPRNISPRKLHPLQNGTSSKFESPWKIIGEMGPSALYSRDSILVGALHRYYHCSPWYMSCLLVRSRLCIHHGTVLRMGIKRTWLLAVSWQNNFDELFLFEGYMNMCEFASDITNPY